ncbi:unnamed protein product [Prorocentrum cordatum]|uniref:Acid protease n=1 Tax=Prorocentrum cordatum TaxID=2364126 RepID=A0ABN9S0H2_9DINO|nr:unnamed protein product [Polarella glacialis]
MGCNTSSPVAQEYEKSEATDSATFVQPPRVPPPDLTTVQSKAICDWLDKLPQTDPTSDQWEVTVGTVSTDSETGNFQTTIKVSTKFGTVYPLLDSGCQTMTLPGASLVGASWKADGSWDVKEPYRVCHNHLVYGPWNTIALLVEGPITIGNGEIWMQFFVDVFPGSGGALPLGGNFGISNSPVIATVPLVQFVGPFEDQVHNPTGFEAISVHEALRNTTYNPTWPPPWPLPTGISWQGSVNKTDREDSQKFSYSEQEPPQVLHSPADRALEPKEGFTTFQVVKLDSTVNDMLVRPLKCFSNAGWKYVEISLAADDETVDNYDQAAHMRLHQARSKIVFRKAGAIMNEYDAVLRLQKKWIMSTALKSLAFHDAQYNNQQSFVVTWPDNNEDTTAMLDTGGGPLIYGAQKDIDKWDGLSSNCPPIYWWRNTEDKHTLSTSPETVRFLFGDFEVTLADAQDRSKEFTYTIKGRKPQFSGCLGIGGKQMSYVNGDDSGIDGINIGGISFLFIDMVIDIDNNCAGFRKKS